MIKLVIFDLDGVLIDAKLIHYYALNGAISKVCGADKTIKWDEHLTTYDGLPTRKKLEVLSVNKGISPSLYDDIWAEKQSQTIEVVKSLIKADDYVQQRQTLQWLVENGYKVFVASNSICESIRCMLSCSELIHYVHRFYSNEDVKSPKPHSEIYIKSILDAGLNPKEVLIIEDSHIGRKSAHESGAHVLGVNTPKDITINNIQAAINRANTYTIYKPKWQGRNMQVLIPMAGAGSRFEKAGYTFPKPLIEVDGKPMIQLIVENLNIDAHYIFICQREHFEKYNLNYMLRLIAKDCSIIQVDGVTEGAACTTLLAKELIDNEFPLLIANSDQYVEWDSNEFLYSCVNSNIDGGILTFNSVHPKWSYAKLDDLGYVCEVAEKRPISNNATVGIYYWSKGSDYVKYAEQMVENNRRSNNEFYVCPVFNEAIADGKKIKTFPIEKMWGIGTPEDLEIFLKEHKQ